jgi:LPS sulfotransferase NodH
MVMPEGRLPSFIVVGPPRTGTSWLHKVLGRCTVLPKPTKETRFFDLHFEKGFDWYLSHFPANNGDAPMGEVAPTYFVSSDARERIAQAIPKVKLIFMFRDPVQRVVSLYRMKRAYGMIPWNFEDAIEKDSELIGSGMYSTQLAEWRRKFPVEQMMVTVYDDLRSDPQQFINSITEFIGIPPITLDRSMLEYVYSSERMTEPRNYLATKTATVVADWCKARRLDQFVDSVRNSPFINLFLGGGDPLTETSPLALKRLGERFLPEVEGIERLLGRSLETWKGTKRA